ncbi:unnamed protein product [Paramecium primaurelia]|uniref:YeeE/YedE family protein n=1 Tax=Paramecium primaurelia TaxID=5886 RepID=A0A8S1P641_PARPR|nr:unnamed protein product [Paramecium primaurelia]
MVFWNETDIGLAVIGGALIGIATSLHYVVKGRVTGFSGILYSIVTYDLPSFFWKVSLMMGVMMASSIFYLAYGTEKAIIDGGTPAYDDLSILTQIGWGGAIIAGFCVGFGTKMGNGCTSGHGVCGLPRLAPRSIVAVSCFMGMGLLTASIKENFIPLEHPDPIDYDHEACAITTLILGFVIILIMAGFQYVKNKDLLIDLVVGTLVGFIFGLGLAISGMVKRSKIIGFLAINERWDPTLIFVMVTPVVINFFAFRAKEKPYLNTKYEIPTNNVIDWKLVCGATIFGFGWGVGGFCPGPAFALFPQFTVHINILFMGTLVIGQLSANYFVKWVDERKKYDQIKPQQEQQSKEQQQKEQLPDISKQQLAETPSDRKNDAPDNTAKIN